MQESRFAEIAGWVTEAALAGRSEPDMLDGFGQRLVAAGVPLATALVIIDTLHPIYEGHAFRWFRDKPETTATGYGRTTEGGEVAERWQRSTFYRLIETGEPMLRRRITAEAVAEFPGLAQELSEGLTDYLAFMTRFASEGAIGEMDCVYSHWVADGADGFTEANIASLTRLMPFLALAMKSATLARMAGTLAETYLGRDAGKLLMSGRIARGVADRIEAVLWFSDLRGYTKITDTAAPEAIIPLLNDYAEAIISAVQENGGDVLKLIGDGVLAIFRAEDGGHASRRALDATVAAGRGIAALNERRAAAGLPVTQMYLGLHIGEVFFGNIGSRDRLDFTVVGPAVNEASRIAAMCRSVDQPVLVSAAFAKAHGEIGTRLVSVGRYALRGVGRPQELFTLDMEAIERKATD
jgi:adenylate cyclase